MNRYLSILILIMLTVLAAACSTKDAPTSDSPYEGEGYILEKNENKILVLDQKFEHQTWNDIHLEYEGQAIWITTKAASKYEIGQKIYYWLKPAVNQSYPALANAKKIKIIEE